jgi:hypothetical protein
LEEEEWQKEVVEMNPSSKWYFDMIQAQLDLAKSALASGYVARAHHLVEIVIADCRALLAELGAGKESK